MAALRPLPQEVRSRLRASAAIASPAQCVEELVLNSLDATSTCVAVRVNLNAGRIQIVDNGVGISPQQLTSVAERYCTSKCHSMADLDNLCHYGYRGEALASMRDMAFMLEIETRGQHSATTYRRIFQKNQEVETVVSETHRPSAGTTVTVYDLFHALPVRKLRLNPVLELERIRQRVEAIALIHPSVSFSLRNDDTCLKILQTHKANSVLGAFTHLFGSAKSRHLVAAHSECGVYTVEGYLSTEPHHSKNLQFIYINERLVFKSPLHKTVNQLVSSSGIVKRRAGSIGSPATGNNSPSSSSRAYGIFVLNVQCPVTLYDITADPAKTLVEFQDWPAVLACMQQAVSDVLLQESLLVTAQTVSANSSDVPNTKTAGVTGTCISTKQLSHTRHSSMVRRPRGTPIDDGVHPADSSSIEKVEESVTTDVSTEQSVRVSDPPGADLTQAGPAAHFLCNTSVSNGTSDAQTTCLPSVAQSPVHQQPSTELHLNKDNARHHLSNTTTTSTSSGNSSQHDSSSSRPRKTGFTSSSKKTATHLISVNDTAPVVCSLRRLREAYTPETIHKAVSAQRLSVAKALKTQNTKSALQTMTEKQGQTAEKPGKESQKRLAGNPSSNLLQLKACTAQQLDKIMLRKLQTLREKLKSKSTPLTKLSQHQPATGSRENQPQRQNQTSLPLASASERKRPTTCAASTLSNKVAKLAQVAESWTSNSSGKQVDTGQNVTQLSKPDLDVAKAVCHVDSTDRQGSHQGDTGGVRENPSNQSVVPVFESQGFFNNTEEFQPTTACEEFDIKPAVSKVMAVNCKESVHVGSLTEEQSHSCRTNQTETDIADYQQTSKITPSADILDTLQTSTVNSASSQTSIDISDTLQISTPGISLSDNIQASRADMSDNIQTSRADMSDNIQASRADMSDNIQASRADMSDNIQASRADMSGNIQASRADMSGNIQASRADMSDNIQTSRADMSDNIQTSRADMSDNIQTSRADMSDNIQTSRADMLDNIQASRADMSDVLHTRAISRAHSLLRPGVASPHNFPKVSLGTSDSLPRSKADGSRSQKTSLTDLDMSHLLAVVSDSWQTCSQQSDVPDKGQMHCLGSDLPDTTNNNQGISGESNTCSIGLLKTAALEPEAFANQSSLILDTDNLCQTKDTPVHPNSAMCGDTATYCHWQTMTDVSGREMFVEPVSGNTSYTAPASATRTFTTVSTSDATIKTVLKPNSLLDHAGCAQLAETQGIDAPTPQPLSPDSQQSLRGLLQAQTQQWQQEHFVKWKQPPDSTTVDVDEDQPTTSFCSFQQYNWKQPPDSSVSQLHKLLLSHKFTANMLKTVQVLGQVDNKFIVCLMSSEDSLHRIGAVADLVVIVDQHAAHERVRLETLIREAYKDPDSAQRSLKAGDITPPMKITLTRDEVRLLQAYKTQVKKIGVQYEVVPSSSESILVHTAPSCLLHREAEEQRRGRNSLTYNTLQAVLKEQINLLLKTGGASQSLPTALHQLLCSQACHGAIKFGDRLSQGQCCELMSALSQCQLPFQCAHGRPAVQPLLSLPQLCRLLPAQMPQHPKLWRLRDM